MKFESLDNLLIQQDQEQFERTCPPPVPIKSDETILKVKRARKSRLGRVFNSINKITQSLKKPKKGIHPDSGRVFLDFREFNHYRPWSR